MSNAPRPNCSLERTCNGMGRREPLNSNVGQTRQTGEMAMNPHFESRERWFLKLRAEWFRVMRPLGSWVPWELRNEVQLQETDEAPSFAFNSPSAWGEGL